jgi:hypothetical protein
MMGSEGGFLWVRIMGDEISEHSITFCWVRFAGKMPARLPATYCTEYYGFKRMKEEQSNRKKLRMQQGLNP